MHRELIIEAFNKAAENLKSQGMVNPSKHQKSIELSDYLSHDYGFSFGEKSLKNYYDASSNSDIKISQLEVVKGLCKYLGFDTYQDYLNSKLKDESTVNFGSDILTGTPEIIVKTRNNGFFAWFSNASAANRKIYMRIGMVVLIGIIGTSSGILMFSDTPKWMIWKEDHYEKTEFDEDNLNSGILSIYKEDQIENFKQILNADCEYQFFNADGSERVWYGKNKNGELELFTDIGLHPETGKSLKPITVHMIRNYICETY